MEKRGSKRRKRAQSEQRFHNVSELSEKSNRTGRVLRLPAEYFSSLISVHCTGTFTNTYPDGKVIVEPNRPNSLSGYCPRGSLKNFAGRQDSNPNLFSSCSCVCPVGTTYSSALNICEQQAVETTLSLTGLGEPRPAGTGGISTVELIAKVMQGGNPMPGIAVSFSVDVTATSGGHDHDDASRPKGNLSGAQGTTDANGEVKLTFTAPQVAGIHTIKAICSSCSNSLATKEIQVKVPELLAIFTLPFRDAQWAYPGIGQVPGRHSDNHYLTVAAVTRLLGLTQKFNRIWPDAPRLTLNDASLAWGGKFDIPATWERNPRAHAEHRVGDNIDVRANAAPGAVPANIRKVVFRWLRDESLPEDNIPPEFVIESVNPLHEFIGTTNEHFHLRLGN